MAHPLIPEILSLATPLASDLNLEITDAVFQTNHNPPTLKITICHQTEETGLKDCEALSRALEAVLDSSEIIPTAYVLEVSTPGIPKVLSTDREFVSFKGFPIQVRTQTPNDGTKEHQGQLIRRDQTHLYLNRKGRTVKIPRLEILTVQLADP
jgi:ribosome maturation factor RimP